MFSSHKQLVPKRFTSTTRISTHQFSVCDPWWSVFDLVETSQGILWSIEPSAFCKLKIGDNNVPLLIPQVVYPKLAAAVMDLGRLSKNGLRPAKYLALFRIYEGLKRNVELPFAAVRHALAHSPEVLNRPKTVGCLTKLFGSVRLDLNNSKHEKVFWHLFVDLLIAVDSLLGQLLTNHAPELKMPKTFRRPLTHTFAMYEMPMQYERWLTSASSRLSAAPRPRAADPQG